MVNNVEKNETPVGAEEPADTETSAALSNSFKSGHHLRLRVAILHILNPTLHVRDSRVNTRDPKEDHECLELSHRSSNISKSRESDESQTSG